MSGIANGTRKVPSTEIVGPVEPRGGPAGIIMQGGKVVAEWGDVERADMTFSIAKSYLSVLTGLAVADGLIADLDEPVGRSVDGPHFASPHNAKITSAAPAADEQRMAGRDLRQVRPGRP